MSRFLKRNLLWLIYGVFVLLVILNHEREHPFISESPYALGKYLIWGIYLSFLAYSLYCSTQENFFSTLRKLYPLHWARQIGLDLYLGLLLSLGMIYLNEGSILIVLIWVIPVVIYANLAILLYMALNYDSIISHFLV
ncbi:MAG: hypothetical protein ABJH98_04140 [Reichenbachiella sp.]|uniref:hypothetical protein n=1 Tax=Reichenbachiella sp. TaxID=2184521 RepID=UPI00329A15ED